MSFFREQQAQDTKESALDSVMPASQQWDEMQRTKTAYQASLRLIGAFLDANEVRHAHIMETVDGYAIRYQRPLEGMKLYTRNVRHTEVLSLQSEAEQKRKRRPFGFGRKQETSTQSVPYENMLRALGYELDMAQAYSLLVDEVDEGFLVTYQYLNPAQGFMVRKRMVFLDLGSVDRVLSDAQARRHDGKRGLLTLLAG